MGSEQSTQNSNSEYKNLFNLLNVIPDLPDHRDYKISKIINDQELKYIDLRDKINNYNFIDDHLGMSIAINICTMIRFNLKQKGEEMIVPSVGFVYIHSLMNEYHSKTIDTLNLKKSKLSIRNTLKSLVTYGICNENDYQSTNINFLPNDDCYATGKNYNFKYTRVEKNIDNIKNILNNENLILINLTLYTSFLKDIVKTKGIIHFPDEFDMVLGMTSAIIVGINKENIILKFAFGEKWGDNGYGYINYEYLNKLINDLWIIEVFVDKRNKYGLNFNKNIHYKNNIKNVINFSNISSNNNNHEDNIKNSMIRNSFF